MGEAGPPVASPGVPGAAALAPSGGPPQLAPEQEAAVSDRGRDLFLTAGAGTGKTTVLVRRFCDAVCATEGDDAGVGVENVLAFTFTERAAGELKRRIRSELLARAGAENDPERARRLRSLARDSESAWISTVHSFCQRVLGSHPLAAGLDPGFVVLDEAAAGRVAGEAFEAAFRRFGVPGDGDRFEMAAAYRLPTLRTAVRAAHDELRSRGMDPPALPALDPPDLAGAAAELHHAARAALDATEGAKATGKFHECRQLMAEALAGTAAGTPPEEGEVAGWGFSSSAKGLDVDEVRRYREAQARLERCVVEARFADHYGHLRELLTLYGEEYARRKEERSALDFEDLQLRARRVLREDADARHRYARQFHHMMVDEFQDTNRLQLDILRLLHREGGRARNRLFTVGDELQSIYGFRHADVGVFRAARAAAEDAPATEAGVRRLAGNFRAAPDLLGVVNRVGRELFGGDYEELAAGSLPEDGLRRGGSLGEEGPPPGGSPPEESPHDAGSPPGDGPPPAVEVLVTERMGWEEVDAQIADASIDERAQAWRVAEARFLAERLSELRDAGVPRGDMVVLLRSFSYVEAYEDALEAMGLAPYVVGGRGYWSRQQVADVRNLLACVANPLDEKALFGALASPACGVSPDTLWLLRQAAGGAPVWSALRWLFGRGHAEPAGDEPRAVGEPPPPGDAPLPDEPALPDEPPPSGNQPPPGDPPPGDARPDWREAAERAGGHIPEADASALRDFVSTLVALREETLRLPLEALIDHVITATGYDLALLMRRRGRRRMANVRKLMRLARKFEAGEGRDLRAFLDFVAAETEAGGREAEAAVDAEGHDGVRLMTVHAAKGLEFPVVAVADLGRSLAAGSPPALRLEPAEDDPGTPEGEGPGLRVGLRLARLGRKQTPIYEYPELQDRAVEREREEERRILHVAMTRAESRLLLSGVVEMAKLHQDPKPHEPLIRPILRSLGWDGAEGSLEVEPPPLRASLEGVLGPVRVRVRVRSPEDVSSPARVRSPEDVSTDARATRRQALGAAPGWPDGAPGAPGTAPPHKRLQDPDMAPPAPPRPLAVRAMSYSALSLYERCGYRFYAERVLGLRPRLPQAAAGVAGAAPEADRGRDAAEGYAPLEAGAIGGDERHLEGDESLVDRYALGRVVHALLERCARDGWAHPDPEHSAHLLGAEGAAATPEEVGRAERLVEAFLAAPIRSELAGAARLHPEAPFAFRAAGMVVRGEIDLLADLGHEVLLLDYKSDALRGSAPADHMARYEVQRRIYALAALRRYGKPVRIAYVFLERPEDPVEARFEPGDAERIGGELDAMAQAIAAGRYEVTPSPERSLCFDCPARERLCVHGPELTMRDRPG